MNPFTQKARKARERADRLSRPTGRDVEMANAFPLGAGYGHGSANTRAKRIDASISRAVEAVEAENRAAWLEANARAFDAGEINAQGRSINAESKARSEKRGEYQEKRAARIEAAKAAIAGMDPLDVDPETWATAHGYLGGSGRALVVAEHRERITGR